MRSKSEIIQRLKATGVVAVIRSESAAALIDVGRALREDGVKFLEITMTVPGALGAVEKAVAALDGEDVHIGVGTVLDAETARLAILAGGEYAVTPVFRPTVVEMCLRYGVAVMPGALTPTELLAAWEAGGDVVKVFPAGVGGPSYFKDLQGPLGHIDLMPTKGGSTAKPHRASSKPELVPSAWAANSSPRNSSPPGTMPPSPKMPPTSSLSSRKRKKPDPKSSAHSPRTKPETHREKQAVFYGELLVRLATKRHERFVQAREFEVTYTGAEANATVCAENFGVDTFVVSAVPAHEIGQACLNFLRQFGVNTDHVLRTGSRLGALYLESGASQRPSKVIYDRSGSSFAVIRPGEFD